MKINLDHPDAFFNHRFLISLSVLVAAILGAFGSTGSFTTTILLVKSKSAAGVPRSKAAVRGLQAIGQIVGCNEWTAGG
jgi:hypothetical protein